MKGSAASVVGFEFAPVDAGEGCDGGNDAEEKEGSEALENARAGDFLADIGKDEGIGNGDAAAVFGVEEQSAFNGDVFEGEVAADHGARQDDGALHGGFFVDDSVFADTGVRADLSVGCDFAFSLYPKRRYKLRLWVNPSVRADPASCGVFDFYLEGMLLDGVEPLAVETKPLLEEAGFSFDGFAEAVFVGESNDRDGVLRRFLVRADGNDFDGTGPEGAAFEVVAQLVGAIGGVDSDMIDLLVDGFVHPVGEERLVSDGPEGEGAFGLPERVV